MRIFNPKYQMSNMDLSMYKAALRDLIFNAEENLKNVDLGSILRALRVLILNTVENRPETPLISPRLLLDTMAQLEVELMSKKGLTIGTMLHVLHPLVNHEVVMAIGFNNAAWALASKTEKLRKEGALEQRVSLPRRQWSVLTFVFRSLFRFVDKNTGWWRNWDWYRKYSDGKSKKMRPVVNNGSSSTGATPSSE